MKNPTALSVDELRSSVGDYYSKRPPWITGYISFTDAQFLAKRIVDEKAGADFNVISYDISSDYYADPTKKVGQAAREQLTASLLRNVTFRNPGTAADLTRFHGNGEIGFLFIDANHMHPWPTLDLLACLQCLKPRATVVLHDINLPNVNPNYLEWGAKYLFDDLDVENQKDEPLDGRLHNIGFIRIPKDKAKLKTQLFNLLTGHKWQVEIPESHLNAIGLTTSNGVLRQLPATN